MTQKPNNINIQIGRELAALRRKAGKTQAHVAAAVGVSEQQISKYERGKDSIAKSRYDAIVAFLTAAPADGFAETLSAYAAPVQDGATKAALASLVEDLSACLDRLRSLAESGVLQR